jgi:hypothetical protein
VGNISGSNLEVPVSDLGFKAVFNDLVATVFLSPTRKFENRTKITLQSNLSLYVFIYYSGS